uniref:HDC00627 n=1 Tax=Drosophila melanogaster TaxID=7227 RepID=Q6IHW7_DROME|nr:TPA_inf: HDC00627 [Drosophila melanogaster]
MSLGFVLDAREKAWHSASNASSFGSPPPSTPTAPFGARFAATFYIIYLALMANN